MKEKDLQKTLSESKVSQVIRDAEFYLDRMPPNAAKVHRKANLKETLVMQELILKKQGFSDITFGQYKRKDLESYKLVIETVNEAVSKYGFKI